MAQKNQNMKEKARDSVEKAAYVAVGVPTAALKALSARVSDLRDTVRSSRRDMTEDLAREIDEWISEGEEVIERAMRRFRDSDVADDVRSQARSTKRAARIGLDKATGAARSGLDMVDPDQELTAINGVGPSYEAKLEEVGIVGISRFLERTETQQDIERLASSSGISEEVLASWRGQVDLTLIDGVGDGYQLLLHRVGIWTMDQLAEADTPELANQMRSVDMPDTPDQIPSDSEIAGWRRAARRLAASG
jgi:predicted flap endonuclease-1-like 5' DNA nuclease